MHWNQDEEEEGTLFQILDSELETDDKEKEAFSLWGLP